MRKIFSYNTIDTIKFFSIVIGLVAALLLFYYFSMGFIVSQYPQPYMVVEAPDNNYTARVYKTNKKEGVTITVSIYDKMSRMYRKNIYSQAYCDKIWISWKKIDELVVNTIVLNVKSKAVKFTKKDENFCPFTSLNN
jgi:spermidine/putrescine-binding protein